MSVWVLSERTQVARKKHTCDFCFGTIEAGEKYTSQANLNDGDFGIWKAHENCYHVAQVWWKIFGCREFEHIPDRSEIRETDGYWLEKAEQIVRFLT
jgi:hypothetical protein